MTNAPWYYVMQQFSVKRIGIFFALAALPGSTATAQQGFEIPEQPYPETGAWSEPGNPGSGFYWEVQNGVLAGAYFGYTDDGQNAWLLFNGVLQPVENNDQIFWTLTSDLNRSMGGECIVDCNSASSNDDRTSETVGSITLDITGRNQAEFSIDGGTARPLVPLVYGVAGFVEFPEQSDVLFPDFSGSWVLTVTDIPNDDSGLSGGVLETRVVIIGEREINGSGTEKQLIFPITIAQNEMAIDDELICSLVETVPGVDPTLLPVCEFPVVFNDMDLEVNNFSDSSITLYSTPIGGSPPSNTLFRVDLFRIGYD